MKKPASSPGKVGQMLGGLSTRTLMFIAGGLFLLDLAVMDPIPFLDEILLAGLTILLARWSSRRIEPEPQAQAPKPPPKNVTPGA